MRTNLRTNTGNLAILAQFRVATLNVTSQYEQEKIDASLHYLRDPCRQPKAK